MDQEMPSCHLFPVSSSEKMDRGSCTSFSEKGLLKIIYKVQLLKWLLVYFSVWEEARLMLLRYQNTELPGENVVRGWQVL